MHGHRETPLEGNPGAPAIAENPSEGRRRSLPHLLTTPRAWGDTSVGTAEYTRICAPRSVPLSETML